jgi:hypothetical protein
MKETSVAFLAFIYPRLAEYPKKGEFPNGGDPYQCHSPRSQGKLLLKPVLKIQRIEDLGSIERFLITLKGAPCFS